MPARGGNKKEKKGNNGKQDECILMRVSLSIYGSCVSRDIFAIANNTKFDLKAYIARQSVISAVAPKLPEGKIPLQNDSPWRMRAVECDLQKNAFDILKQEKSDYLLIDLIDERFPLLPLFGSYVTASNEFYESTPEEYDPSNENSGNERSFPLLFSRLGHRIAASEKYPPVKKIEKSIKKGKLYLGKRCVENALKEFCVKLEEIYPTEQIILHCAIMLDQYRSKSGQLKTFPPHQLNSNRQINAILEVMYGRIQAYLPGMHVIQETNGMVADENHKWGLAPMHYQKEYYERVLTRLYEIAGL